MNNQKTNKFDVVGFGALNMDQLHYVDKLAGADEESFITGVSESCGGSAANTTIGLSRMGLKTGFLGKVSGDREGNTLLNNLIQEKVNTDGVTVSSSGRSGRVMGFVDKQGQRSLYVDPGVNDLILMEDIDLSYLNHTQFLHLTSFVGDSFKAQEELISEIRDKIKISFDPGRIYVEKGFESLERILNRTDILLINEVELELLLKNRYESYIQGAKLLLKEGIGLVVVKRGSQGSYAVNDEFEVSMPCLDVKCVDTTGAGDAFNAGLLYSLIQNYSLKEGCEFANYVASKCIECYGATDGLPYTSNTSE
ncbi:carbohydrate kinase family protein [Methanobacterium alcaliphilum]|uniref:carbohydrate kinase family protein n=1 Tax=Methanobacterium alcaliphilum TaxID=392018 RepID=UPI00200A79F5|nr:carbohydrate kinase family protein [Methanobacterium alcaliphilum]MCK9150726.1 carbohydrate kinase family protein [Methanobacterium alcaliphilum]